ncbi:hypothetical protein AB6A40_008089, partial [Gnathostoma spinigerum]
SMFIFKNGEWGKEERISNPYKPGGKFDIRIRAHENHFEMIVERKKVHEYKYRLPLGSIRFLDIHGDCMLGAVHWSGRTYAIPFECAFPKGHFGSGERLYLSGVPKDNFSVNLLDQSGDILFHFNPRFTEKKIVRNSRIEGHWETEEREGEFPFKKNTGFDLVFQNEPYAMQIYCDRRRILTFAHRCGDPTKDYTSVRIEGGIEVVALEFDSSDY